jgi:hypothetical protein
MLYVALQHDLPGASPMAETQLDETRATAHLPNLAIEIRHRRLPEEGAELLAISLKATPDFEQALGLLDPARLMALWLGLNPWLAFNPWLAPFLAARAPRPLPDARGPGQHRQETDQRPA